VEHTVVTVVSNEGSSTFERMIPQEYYLHLCWIQQESVGTSDRCRWLWNILDCLAEELEELSDRAGDSWRSPILNSLLTRAFYGLSDQDQAKIEEHISQHGDPITMDHCRAFYFDKDVIHRNYVPRWNKLKPNTANSDRNHLVHPEVIRKCGQNPCIGIPLTYRKALTISHFVHL
jgi:hypothetical protein